LLRHWRRLSFPFQWRGRQLQVSIGQQEIEVAVAGDAPLRLFDANGKETLVRPGQKCTAEYSDNGVGCWQTVGA
jgi:trehalose/maltose hydrolase-like predicted phosphorylase